MRKWGVLLVLVMALATLAACEKKEESPKATAQQRFVTATRSPAESPAVSVDDNGQPVVPTYPPTWTPVATKAPPTPRPTVAGTYFRPTDTPITYPTYTPSPIPPTATPAGPVLTVTADMINEELSTEMSSGVGGFFTDVPTVAFEDELLFIHVNTLTTPGDISTARMLEIQIRVEAVEGRILLTKIRSFFPDDGAIYESEMVDNLLSTAETMLNNMVVQTVGAGTRFGIVKLEVSAEGIVVETVVFPA